MDNEELITIRQIEERYGIASKPLKTIRSPRKNFGFPAPIENENPRDRVKKYRLDQVDAFFRKNNIKQKSVSSKATNLFLSFYKRNFPAKLHGGGETKTVIVRIRPDDNHWDNEHQRGGFSRSSGVTTMYSEGM